MRLAIMQPYFFPYLGYWQLLEAADVFVFYDDVQFMRRSFMTRNSILLEEKPYQFTLPTVKADRTSLINEILLDKEEYEHWSEKFLATLYHAYSKAPHFSTAYPVIENILQQYTTRLSDFLKKGITEISEYLSIEVAFTSSSTVNYRRDGNAEEKIISLCKHWKADVYINPIGGKHLYHPDTFDRNSIQLLFLQSQVRHYEQFDQPFVKNLSIIDMMMFLSKDALSKRLRDFQLIQDEAGK